MRYLVQVQTHFVVEADSPEQSYRWLNGEVELKSTSLGHTQLVSVVDDPAEIAALRKQRGEDAFWAVAGHWPLSGNYSPAAWPARSLTSRLSLK